MPQNRGKGGGGREWKKKNSGDGVVDFVHPSDATKTL